MLRRALRVLQRVIVFGLGILCVWLIVDVFKFADHRLPTILALSVTYAMGAYLILPNAVRMGLKILQRRHVPSFTITGDGLPGDPINVALAGTFDELRSAFHAAGWIEADKLSLASSWRMARAFVLNHPYPAAPFSTLYLFGRGQDIGFQKAIDNSPRKRHHIRFWAQSLATAQSSANTLDFWLNTDRPDDQEHVLWIGAGTQDTGFSLTRLTFQITHATASDTDIEREFIIEQLTQCGAIMGSRFYKAGDQLRGERVNHYVTDGDVAIAKLEPRITQ